ncbi:TIM barrel protein [Halobacillus litoralis]|uniref:TIM barrel protein n=1 Tax=Halobacillus litoralis TaxID=45668 RepID=A0A845DZG6_9BACI|nr:TIM barrel protein [Halobacillus litoralis]MYL47863.1 TIM barrel protein [Halobacillus litoralis]
MAHSIGMSGSTILSDRNRLPELFNRGLPHVEIGEFGDMDSYLSFLKLVKENKVSFGIHVPHFRENSKYDLLEEVKMQPSLARELFVEEVQEAARSGASYVLVHFPYFKGETDYTLEKIEEGLQFLHHLQESYGVPIVCEPKLGQLKSPAGIQYLYDFPMNLWGKYGLHICVDIGDYRIAVGDNWRRYIEPLLPYTKVVHMHNVQFTNQGYIWTLIHPDFEKQGTAFDMAPCIELLAKGRDKYFILEHTPHTNPSEEEVDEGVEWVIEQLK